MFGIKTYILKKTHLSFEKTLKENSFPKKELSFIQKEIIS